MEVASAPVTARFPSHCDPSPHISGVARPFRGVHASAAAPITDVEAMLRAGRVQRHPMGAAEFP
jgi:hypothetical protein